MTVLWQNEYIEFALLHLQRGTVKEHFYIIAYTHRNLSVQDIGVLHIAEENQGVYIHFMYMYACVCVKRAWRT